MSCSIEKNKAAFLLLYTYIYIYIYIYIHTHINTRTHKGMTEDEMVGLHHCLNGHEFELALGDGE